MFLLHVAPRFYFCEFCEAKKSNACDAVSFIWLHRSTGCVLIYFTEEILSKSGFLCFASRDRDAVTTQYKLEVNIWSCCSIDALSQESSWVYSRDLYLVAKAGHTRCLEPLDQRCHVAALQAFAASFLSIRNRCCYLPNF